MSEVIAGFAGGEVSRECADPAAETGNGSLGQFPQQRLEFAEWHLDGVGQIAKSRASCFDRFAYARNLMRGETVFAERPRTWRNLLVEAVGCGPCHSQPQCAPCKKRIDVLTVRSTRR